MEGPKQRGKNVIKLWAQRPRRYVFYMMTCLEFSLEMLPLRMLPHSSVGPVPAAHHIQAKRRDVNSRAWFGFPNSKPRTVCKRGGGACGYTRHVSKHLKYILNRLISILTSVYPVRCYCLRPCS